MEVFDLLAAPGYPVFLGSEFEPMLPQDARFHILPIPYEASVTYGGGTAKGPAKILEASWQLEAWDGKSVPGEQGIFTHPPVCMEGGAAQVVDNIALATQEIIEQGGFPVGLGGEHTVTLGVINGLLDAGVKDLGVVQIDAHADLREAYEGNPFSHASVMKRIIDQDIPLLQLGVRAFCEEERDIRQAHKVYHFDAEELVPGNVCDIQMPVDFPENVFFTLDVDGIDPSVFPSTGTPVPGGLLWYQTLGLFESVAKQRNIIGFDITEFAPIKGFHCYEFSAAMLVYKMMGIVERQCFHKG